MNFVTLSKHDQARQQLVMAFAKQADFKSFHCYIVLLLQLLSQDDIVIAKMDATANEIQPGFEVDSYPTLHWVPKNKLNSMQYQVSFSLKA